MLLFRFSNNVSRFDWNSQEHTFCPSVIINDTSFDSYNAPFWTTNYNSTLLMILVFSVQTSSSTGFTGTTRGDWAEQVRIQSLPVLRVINPLHFRLYPQIWLVS